VLEVRVEAVEIAREVLKIRLYPFLSETMGLAAWSLYLCRHLLQSFGEAPVVVHLGLTMKAWRCKHHEREPARSNPA
jgi:hypothetical protein